MHSLSPTRLYRTYISRLYCNDSLLVESHIVVHFLINHENDTDVTLSSKQMTFNDIPRLTHLTDYPRRRLHLFVIILKQYIYACKCSDKKPCMQEFQRKVILQWQIEKCALP